MSHSLYLVRNGANLSMETAALLLAAGFICVAVNYDADRQRVYVRTTSGKGGAWGPFHRLFSAPGRLPRTIAASYTTSNGQVKTNLLLADGWWSLSRHFHYVPEILAALCWSLPGGQGVMPYFYVSFLTILLSDRAWRDDARCAAKYGAAWGEYCKAVPYKIVPYLL